MPQGGTTYRYGFTGSFVDGLVMVNFGDGKFADLNANTNAAESESFTVAVPPTVEYLDDGDPGYGTSGTWNTFNGAGYQNDLQYASPGGGAFATWTFSGLAAGTYRVSATWLDAGAR